ncbi:MAG: ATP-dependent DNA ligase [Burkholderiales bacterium]
MQAFAALVSLLDATTSTQAKVQAIADHLSRAPTDDAAWAVFLLCGGKRPQTVPSRVLREAALQGSGLTPWLFEECYAAVGDLAETIALLVAPLARGTSDAPQPLNDAPSDAPRPAPDVPEPVTDAPQPVTDAPHRAPDPGHPSTGSPDSLHHWMTERLPAWRTQDPAQGRNALCSAWATLDATGIFTLNKLITGGLRLGVSRQTVSRALSLMTGLDSRRIAQRLMGYVDRRRPPGAAQYLALIAPEDSALPVAPSRGDPYPFFLAHALQQTPETLGSVHDWMAEWKWDGIRAQVVIRAGEVWVWSRGEELVNEQFPELIDQLRICRIDDEGSVVLDGELLAWDPGLDRPRDFAVLQRRLQRRQVSAALRRDYPVRFVAYDLLEARGQDLREHPLHARRQQLERLAERHGLHLSQPLPGSHWEDWRLLRQAAREQQAEGLMLKHRHSTYGVGRTRPTQGAWWKWKLDPMTVDAVLVYAQRGHGRRASLLTDYTFAVWDRPADDGGERVLLPFAKAYSGLTDAEIRAVDAHLRKTTRESFGPVRSVEPTLVFELGFEGISASSRHKSGVAVRFPRILRWRTDKTPEQADHLDILKGLIPSHPSPIP